MAIPLQPNVTKDAAFQAERKRRRWQAVKDGQLSRTPDIRRLLQKALIASTEADNGDPRARNRALVYVDSAIDRGLSKTAITDGPNLTQAIAATLDRTPALDHLAGLLYEAADMLAEAGETEDARAVLAIAKKHNTAANVEAWRERSRPVKIVYRNEHDN